MHLTITLTKEELKEALINYIELEKEIPLDEFKIDIIDNIVYCTTEGK